MSGALLYGDPLFAYLKGLFGLFSLLLDFNADTVSDWLSFYDSKKCCLFLSLSLSLSGYVRRCLKCERTEIALFETLHENLIVFLY